MFDDFYGLAGKPFQLTPDPAFYFRSVTHRKALREELVTIIRMLTGQPPAIKGELTLQPAEA